MADCQSQHELHCMEGEGHSETEPHQIIKQTRDTQLQVNGKVRPKVEAKST